MVTPHTGKGLFIFKLVFIVLFVSQTGNDCVFDPMNPYSRFKLNLANSTSDVNVTPPGCVDSIFRRLDAHQGSKVLEQTDEYG